MARAVSRKSGGKRKTTMRRSPKRQVRKSPVKRRSPKKQVRKSPVKRRSPKRQARKSPVKRQSPKKQTQTPVNPCVYLVTVAPKATISSMERVPRTEMNRDLVAAISAWYQELVKLFVSRYSVISDVQVTHDDEFIYVRFKSETEKASDWFVEDLEDPDDDGNYPLSYNGQMYLIDGEIKNKQCIM